MIHQLTPEITQMAFYALRFAWLAGKLTSTSPIPIPLPTHHHQPNQVCHSTAANNKCCNQSIPSSATATKLTVVETTAKSIAPNPNTAVPPSVLHALRRFTKKPQIIRAIVNMRSRVELRTFRIESDTSRTFWDPDNAVNTRPEEAMASGPILSSEWFEG